MIFQSPVSPMANSALRTTAYFNLALYVVLESQIARGRIIVQANIASEQCNKLEEKILKERFRIKVLEEELKRETTRSGKQTSELQEHIDDLEKRLHSAVQANENLRENLRKTEIEIRSLHRLIQQNEKKAKEKENQLSVQLMEALEKLRLSEATINMPRHLEKESELMNSISQLQTQLLSAHEKVLRLEGQLREQQSVIEPVETSIHEAPASEEIETDVNETEPKIGQTDFNYELLNVTVPLLLPA